MSDYKDFGFGPRPGEEKESFLSEIRSTTAMFDTKDEAIQAVKDFWAGVPHGQNISGVKNWGVEITMSDRTSVSKEDGRWQVYFRGNHENLSTEAVKYLRNKGYLKE
jgi:hypothetical protein